jgi:hypothetical protein
VAAERTEVSVGPSFRAAHTDIAAVQAIDLCKIDHLIENSRRGGGASIPLRTLSRIIARVGYWPILLQKSFSIKHQIRIAEYVHNTAHRLVRW